VATFRSKRRDEHCSSGIRNECNLLQANLTSRSPPRRKVAGRFHRGPQANPTCRIAETQPRTSDARPYIRFVTRSAWVRFGGRATTHRNCQLSTVNCQLSTIRMFATPLWDRLNCYAPPLVVMKNVRGLLDNLCVLWYYFSVEQRRSFGVRAPR
jgi:hypothetical protein